MANKGKHLIENDYTPVTYDPQYIPVSYTHLTPPTN